MLTETRKFKRKPLFRLLMRLPNFWKIITLEHYFDKRFEKKVREVDAIFAEVLQDQVPLIDIEGEHNLGTELHQEGKCEEAILHYRKAIQGVEEQFPGFPHPHFGIPYYCLGIALEETNQVDEAISCLERAIEINPQHGEAYHQLGMIKYGKGNIEESIEDFEKAIKHKPDYAWPHAFLGNALYDQGNLESAANAYIEAAALAEDNKDVQFAAASLLHQNGDYKEAVVYYDRFLSLNPQDDTALRLRAKALQQQKEELPKSLTLVTGGKS